MSWFLERISFIFCKSWQRFYKTWKTLICTLHQLSKICYCTFLEVIYSMWWCKLNLPLATGDTAIKLVRAAPVPWPITVMLSGSPPKAGRFSLSQCSPAIRSISPKLPCALPRVPVFRKPVCQPRYVITVYILSFYIMIYNILLVSQNKNHLHRYWQFLRQNRLYWY